LNASAALPKAIHRNVRSILQKAFSRNVPLPAESTADIKSIKMHLPVAVGDFTDFSAAKDHVLNMSEILTGKRSCPPSFLSFPIGYGGRSSSIRVSGAPIERPFGQFVDRSKPGENVVYAPSQQLDYELEVGAVIGKPVEAGQRVQASGAEEHIFGFVLLNDWSGMLPVQTHDSLILYLKYLIFSNTSALLDSAWKN
jgi:fumarylacetoacetase